MRRHFQKPPFACDDNLYGALRCGGKARALGMEAPSGRQDARWAHVLPSFGYIKKEYFIFRRNWNMFQEAVQVVKEKDPAIKSTVEVLLYPSFWAVINHRIAHSLYKKKMFSKKPIQ